MHAVKTYLNCMQQQSNITYFHINNRWPQTIVSQKQVFKLNCDTLFDMNLLYGLFFIVCNWISWSNQRNYMGTAIPCSKNMLKQLVATSLLMTKKHAYRYPLPTVVNFPFFCYLSLCVPLTSFHRCLNRPSVCDHHRLRCSLF